MQLKNRTTAALAVMAGLGGVGVAALASQPPAAQTTPANGPPTPRTVRTEVVVQTVKRYRSASGGSARHAAATTAGAAGSRSRVVAAAAPGPASSAQPLTTRASGAPQQAATPAPAKRLQTRPSGAGGGTAGGEREHEREHEDEGHDD